MMFRCSLSTMIATFVVACAGHSGDTDDNGDTSDTGEPAVCGDGVLGSGEACDVPDNAGCDAACHLTGDLRWTVTRGGAGVWDSPVDVAVGADGQVVLRVSGWNDELQQHIGTLIAYDSAGTQLWQADTSPAMRETDVPSRVAIGPDGSIYVQGWGLECFDPEGHRKWGESSPEQRTTTAITLGDGALFSASYGVGGGSVPDGPPPTDGRLHRRDPATGEVLWETVLAGDTPITLASTIAVVGSTLVAAGNVTADRPGDGHAFACVEAATGAPVPCLAGEEVKDYTWLAATPSGDLVVAMQDHDEQAQIRRLSLEGVVRWTITDPPAPGTVGDVVVGPDEWIATAARLGDPFTGRGSLRMYTDAGEPAWSVDFPPEHDGDHTVATAVAFGPGFLVIAGSEPTNDGVITWIRKLGP